MMNLPLDLASLLRHAAREHGGTPLITLGSDGSLRRSTWADLEQRARRWGQAWQRLGLPPGSTVALLGWNAQGLLEAVLGTAAAGLQALALNPRQFPEQLIFAINRCQAQAMVVDPQMAPLLEAMQLQMASVSHYVQLGGPEALPLNADSLALIDAESMLTVDDPDWQWPEVDERQPALISFTSTNAGWPRGVPTSHRGAVLQAWSAALPDAYGLSRHDTVMPLLPVSHSGGWALCLSAALVGSRLVLVPPGMEARHLVECMANHHVTLAAGPPNIWQAVMDALDDGAPWPMALQRASVGAAAFPPPLLDRLRTWPGLKVLHTWGMSEVAPPALVADDALLTPDAEGRLPQGRAAFGVELALADDAGRSLARDGLCEGHLLVRGPWTLDAYIGEAETPLLTLDGEGAWLPTGDIARITPEGVVTITDRRKDLIRCGGEWISAQLLERIAKLHPSVGEAAVIAQADPQVGESPLLVVVIASGAEAPPNDELLALYDGRVADWQRPRGALVFPELPKLPTGEVDKRELRALVETLLD
jgi:acyl-CoA synthetase (AMP-forming)/AMP-acid ligase II